MQTIYGFYKSKVSGQQYKKLPSSLNNMGIVIVVLIWMTGLFYYVHMFEMSDKSGRLWFAASYIIVYGFLMFRSEIWEREGTIFDYAKKKTIILVNVLEHFIIVASAQAVLTVLVLVKYGKFHMEYIEGIDFLFFFPIIQTIVFFVTFILGRIIGDKIIYNNKYFQKVDEILRYNGKINRELEQWEIDKKKIEKISEIQDLKIIDYMNKAIILLNENSNYEDSMANVRRALEYYLYKKTEADNIMLKNEREFNTWGVIQYYRNYFEYSMKASDEVRRMCNGAVHVLGDGGTGTLKKWECSMCIDIMLDILSTEYTIFNKSKEQLEVINKNIELFEGRVAQHISNDNWDDALLNIRKTLESVVSGYVKAFHIICLYGHEKNLKGYIDVLNEKNIISNISKENMHKIRMSCNESDHTNNTIESAKKIEGLNNILKKEIKIYFKKKDSESTEKAILDKVNSEDDYIDNDLSTDNLEDDYDYENSNENMYANNQEDDYEDRHEDDYEDDYGYVNYRYRDTRHYYDPYIQTDPYLYNNPSGLESIYDHDGFDED